MILRNLPLPAVVNHNSFAATGSKHYPRKIGTLQDKMAHLILNVTVLQNNTTGGWVVFMREMKLGEKETISAIQQIMCI